MQPITVYLSLGANLGNREQTLSTALAMLAERIGPIIAQSHFYYSAPWGFESEHGFCNLCASYQTTLSPIQLLDATQDIERQLGRTTKSGAVYHDRTIDIDILLYGDVHMQTERLTIPHPLMTQRDFVMVPLREIFDGQV